MFQLVFKHLESFLVDYWLEIYRIALAWRMKILRATTLPLSVSSSPCLRVVNFSLWMKTVNKCNVFNCNGNYNDENKHRVFRLPKDQIERQLWINKLPPLKDFVKIPGGSTRSSIPPTLFNVPTSCLPVPKPSPRSKIVEDRQLEYFNKTDSISSLSDFQWARWSSGKILASESKDMDVRSLNPASAIG